MLFTKVLSMKTTLIAAVVALLVGIAIGAWGTNKFYSFSKIAALEAEIERQKEAYENTSKILRATHEKQLKIAKDSVKIVKVKEYVKDNRECDVSYDAERLLDSSRTGLPSTSARTDEGVPGLTRITQRQQIESCARDGLQYRELKASYDGLREFIQENWREAN